MRIKTLSVEQAKTRRPLVILKGVTKVVGSDDIIDVIEQQNPTLASIWKSRDDLKKRFVRSNAKNEDLYNIVFEVSADVRIHLLEIGRINVDHQRVRVVDFSGFIQCFMCLQFGHTRARCTSDVKACSHCASKEHTWKDYKISHDNDKLKCHNCKTRNEMTGQREDVCHSATSAKDCPRIKAMITRINARTDYGGLV